MKYHPVTEKIKNILEEHNAWYETFEHKPVRTSEEAAKIRDGYTLKQGAKAIIIRIKKSKSEKRFIMLVIPGDKRFDNKKIKKYFEVKNVRFATEAEVSELTDNVKVGGVPPFGDIFKLEVYVDESLFENDRIVFNAGDRRFSIGMKLADFKDIVKPELVNII